MSRLRARLAMTTTTGTLLGNRLRFRQPKRGYRVAVDTVLLAASVPARAGERVADLGTGVGGAALCLAARVEGVAVTGFDIDPGFVGLANENAVLNGLANRVRAVVGDVARLPAELAAGSVHHVMANPPYLRAGSAVPSPDPLKARATMEGSAPLAAWLEAAAALAMPGGTITFIHRADRAAELLSLMEWRAGDIVVCPLWPKKGENAKRVLVQGRAGAAGATRFARGLVLHEADGRYTVEADAVLRGGAMLDLSVL